MKNLKQIQKQLDELKSKLLRTNDIYICIGKNVVPLDDPKKIIFHLDI